MQQQFLHFIEKHGLLSREQPVFVAVSGGIDSMVLLHLFAESGFSVTAAHVNFGLRGEESDTDEIFVRERCHRWGVLFLSKHVTTKNYATTHGLSTQMAARELRYQWFSDLLASKPGSVLATAHHLNDSGETMLLNLIRGTGIDGLTGIPVQNGRIIRPLAFATRAAIHQYAAAHAITWREDASNADDYYQRNFLRNRVMGLLKQINPSLDDTLSRNSSRLNGERELVERSVADWRDHFVQQDGGLIRIRKEGLNGFIHKSGVLLRMIEPFGFNFAAAESIVAAMEGQPGKKFITGTHELVVDRTELIIREVGEPLAEVLIHAHDTIVRSGPLQLTLERTTDTRLSPDRSLALIDAAKIQYPLTWRKWREGDDFQPLGMKGRKKLSDFLIDEKISLSEKQSVTVVTSGGEIVWVAGLRLSDKVRLTEATTMVLKVSLKVIA